MGESTSHRTARGLAALAAAGVTALLLTSCAGLAGAAGAPSAPAGAVSSAPAEVASSAPAETPSAAASAPSGKPSTTAKASVEPFITSALWDGKAGRLDVGALVPKVVESGGTCTLTAVRGGTRVEASGAAVAASSYTGCPQLAIDRDRLAAGDWTVTVSYASDASSGTSKPRAVTVG